MAFRRGIRRSFRRRRPSQLNWITAFTNGVVPVPAGGIVYFPLTNQVEQESSSDQVVERVRGWLSASTVLTSAATIGNCTAAIFVEDAKDITLGNVGALPNPRGATLEEVEPDKYMHLWGPFNGALADATPNVIGSTQIDAKAKRRLDLTYQQLVMSINNPTAAAVNIAAYVRVLLRERGT